MKALIFLMIGLLTIPATWAQNVGVGTASPAASAKLDISSTTQGFLPPRMTIAQRNAIANPANGLVIYCIDCGYGQLNVFNYSTSSWTNMNGTSPAAFDPLVIGQVYGGGKLAYFLQAGDPGYDPNMAHGLIAAATDQSNGTDWGCVNTAIPGADGLAYGTGYQNSIDILAGCPAPGAALACLNLSINGFTDWYLPSRYELSRLYINRVAIGSFYPDTYWSSSEFDNGSAWANDFGAGYLPTVRKDSLLRVRAIRTF